ncbi:unnamed protein product [Phytomonas sp. Hart1]|nr:unnamed protein product [Phytomonas sp. Hart1]|eukprot:CCW67437.1 unnamed protein product [Phytomonas sp. isolate Hart1]
MEPSEIHSETTVRTSVRPPRNKTVNICEDDISVEAQDASVDEKEDLKESCYDYQDGDVKKKYTSYSTQILEWMTDGKLLDGPQTDDQGNSRPVGRRKRSLNKQSDLQHRREQHLRRAEKREFSKRKFDLAEELFERALNARQKAMRRIAADPPADRLIGHNMLQYIPAALIKGQLKEMVEYLQRTSPHGLPPCELENPAMALTPASARLYRTAANALVFLTETNDIAGARGGSEPPIRVSSSHSKEVPTEDGVEKEADRLTSSLETPFPLTAGARARPPKDRLAHWRELGYDAIYLIPPSTPQSRRRRGLRGGESIPAGSQNVLWQTQLMPVEMTSNGETIGRGKAHPLPPISRLPSNEEASSPLEKRHERDRVGNKPSRWKALASHRWKINKTFHK